MAKHLTRQSVPVTSYLCKRGEHGAVCDELTAELAAMADGRAPLVCHCACHAPCDRPKCEGRQVPIA